MCRVIVAGHIYYNYIYKSHNPYHISPFFLLLLSPFHSTCFLYFPNKSCYVESYHQNLAVFLSLCCGFDLRSHIYIGAIIHDIRSFTSFSAAIGKFSYIAGQLLNQGRQIIFRYAWKDCLMGQVKIKLCKNMINITTRLDSILFKLLIDIINRQQIDSLSIE